MAKKKVEDQEVVDETVTPDPEKHVFLEDGQGGCSLHQVGDDVLAEVGGGPIRLRAFRIGTKNYEHVSDREGCWVYRRM